MKKNVAGQKIGAQLVSASDGSAFTGAVTVYVTGDAGTQAAGSVGAGACTHEGNGYHTYAPAQAETNYDLIAFTFIGTGAVPATVQIFATFPQTGDNFARLGAPAGASVSADIAAVKVDTAAVKVKTDFLPSATAGASGGLFIAGTNAATAVTTSFTTTFTGNLTGSVGSVTGAVGSVTGNVGGSVASVTGNVGGNVVGSVASVTARVTANTDQLAGQTVTAAAGVTFPTSVASPTNITAGTITTATNVTTVNGLAAGVITATSIAADAITDAKVAADVTIASVTGSVGSVTGAVGSVTGAVGSVTGSVGSVVGNVGGNVTGSVGSVATGGIASTSFAAGAIDAAAIATDAFGALELAAGAASEIATAVRSELTTELGRIDAAVSTRASQTSLDTLDDYVDTEVAAIKTKTDFLPSATAGAAGGLFIAGANAATSITTALTANIVGNVTGNLSGSVGSVTGLTASNLDATISSRASQASVDDLPTNAELATALAAADDAVLAVLGTPAGASLAADIAAIEAQTDDIGAAGAGLTAVPWNAAWDAEVQSEVADALVAYGAATATDVTTAAANVSVDEIQASALADLFNTDSGTTYASAVAGSVVAEIADNAGGSGLTLADIADAVWDEAIAGHAGAGSTGQALSAAGAAGDPWITAIPGSYTAGQAGYILGTNLNATVSSRATQTSVDDLPTNAELATALGTADDAVLAVLGSPAGASLAADVAAVKAQTAAIETDTQDIQGRLPAALVSGRIDASVGAMEANTLTASALAADAVTEIQSGLSTLTAAGVRTAVGLASANLDTQLDALPTNAELATALGTADDAVLLAIGDLPTNAELATALGTADDAVLAAIAALSIPTAGAVADAVWDEAVSAHLSAGTFGKALDDTDDRGSRTVIRGTVDTGATATTLTPSALSPAGVDADQFKGRILIFDNDTTTAALRGQATDITASTGAALPLFTFSTLTTAPAAGDTFSIV